MGNWQTALTLAIKELVKVALLAVLPLLIVGLSTNSIDMKAIIVAGAIAVLTAINEFLKKSDQFDTKGLMG